MIFKEIKKKKNKKAAWSVPRPSKHSKSGAVRTPILTHAAALQPLLRKGAAEHEAPWNGGGNLSSARASILPSSPEAAVEGLLRHGASGKRWDQLSVRNHCSKLSNVCVQVRNLLSRPTRPFVGGVFVNMSTASINTGFTEIWWSW